jgi:hypothetical protein
MKALPKRAGAPFAAGVAAILLFFLLLPGVARAQSMTIVQVQSLPRETPTGELVTKRPLTFNPEGINLQDCRDDLRIVFPLALSGFVQNDTIEVWGSDQGTDCADPVNRSAATALCYKLRSLAQLSPTPQIKIPVKEIIRGRQAEDEIDSDGCRRLNQGQITLQFLYFRGAPTGQPAQRAQVPILVDTQGPEALQGIRVMPGNGRFTVSWNAIGEGGVADIIGVNAYCLANPTAVEGAGGEPETVEVCDVLEDGGDGGNCRTETVDDGTGTVVVCDELEDGGDGGCRTEPAASGGGGVPDPGSIPSPGVVCSAAEFSGPGGERLVPDQAFAAAYQCGNISGMTGNSVNATSVANAPLLNGTVYAVAVAATDSFANIGELSDVYCQFPEVTGDFWQDYRDGGGRASGCSVEGLGVPAGSITLLGLVGALGVSTWRRRRRNR